ncbi:hypothetical protein GXW71_07000 [Roseomonas hellenica]|uniref:Glycosyltransferase RgtA/B/C/D-like domain-containing protein n=1 Tax=Plastoroseomonas hellenica TaxID=2687306 RepID=A0ABS5EUX3_9PROT|nr:hypothetical protein [Plastoroseomonas hellenica]MBR0664100.1 hypothetical protein [Plastoroseomonas hellenica]
MNAAKFRPSDVPIGPYRPATGSEAPSGMTAEGATSGSGRWPDTFAVAAASSLLAVLAVTTFGVVATPDTPAYLHYAELLRGGPLPSGEDLLRSGFQPTALFRTPGYPGLIAAVQYLDPSHWMAILITIQIAAQAAVAAAAHRAGLALRLGRRLALAAALMPATGFAAIAQIMVLTDAVYAALVTLALLLLLRAGLAGGRILPVLAAGLLLAAATTVREVTPFLALLFLPAAAIAAGPRRRLVGMGLLAGPIVLATGWIMLSHHARSGHAVLSTTRQIVMVQALLPALKRGVAIYHGDDLYDRTARETVVPLGYEGIDILNSRLFEAGLSSPEIAALASARYMRAWREYPLQMMRGIMTRFPARMLWIAFAPVDTVADLHRYSGSARPWFGREAELLRRLGQGSVLAGFLLLALVLGRMVGVAVTIAALAAPLLISRRDARYWPLLAMWLASGAFLAVYLPVHLETRYLLPIIPLLCLLGCAVLHKIWHGMRRNQKVAD